MDFVPCTQLCSFQFFFYTFSPNYLIKSNPTLSLNLIFHILFIYTRKHLVLFSITPPTSLSIFLFLSLFHYTFPFLILVFQFFSFLTFPSHMNPFSFISFIIETTPILLHMQSFIILSPMLVHSSTLTFSSVLHSSSVLFSYLLT